MAGSKYEVEVVDKTTGPLKKIQAQARKTASSLKAINQSGRSRSSFISPGSSSTGKGGKSAISTGDFYRKQIADSAAATERHKASFASLRSTGINALRSLVRMWAIVATAAVAAAFGVVAYVAKIETLRNGLNKVTGSVKEGGKAMKIAQDLAAKYGGNAATVAKQLQDLRAAQFSIGEATNILKMSADLRTIGADSKGVIRAMSQIKAAGRLMGQELIQLMNAGISVPLIYDEIGKALGKNRQEVIKMKEAGLITADVANKAIQAAVKQKLHIAKLGDAALDSQKTMTGMYELIKGRLSVALLRIATVILPMVKSALGPLAKSILDAFGGEGEAGAKNFEMVMRDVEATVRDTSTEVRKFFDSAQGKLLVAGLKAIVVAVGAVVAVFVTLAAIGGAVFGGIMQKIGAVFSLLTSIWGGVWSTIQTAIDGGFSGIIARVTQLGRDFVAGFISGIRSMFGGVSTAASGMANVAAAATKAAQQSNSPAKVSRFLGRDYGAGFAGGIMDRSPLVGAASGAMVGAANAGASVTNNFAPTVNAGSGGDMGSAIAVLGDLMDTMATEMGA